MLERNQIFKVGMFVFQAANASDRKQSVHYYAGSLSFVDDSNNPETDEMNMANTLSAHIFMK